MKDKITFEDFIRRKCPSIYQTNNSSDGEDRWIEQLDGSEYEELGQLYGEYMFLAGEVSGLEKGIKIIKTKDPDAEYMQKLDIEHDKITLHNQND